MSHRRRAERLAFLLQTARELERFSLDVPHDRLLRHVHRSLGPVLEADLGFVWRLRRGCQVEAVYHWAWTPRGRKLLERTTAASLQERAIRFARDQKSPGDRNLLLTLVQARGRPIGVLGFLRPSRAFGRADARLGNEAAELLGRQLNHREREKTYELRERIIRKVLLQLRPADILYQVLHGLKRLLRYDHSASVHTIDHASGKLTTRAEVIAWTKGKSVRIGEKLALGPDALRAIDRMSRLVLLDPHDPDNRIPAGLLEPLATTGPGTPPARSLLLAPLRQHDEAVGILAIRWLRPAACVASDQETVDSFLHIISATALHSEFFRLQQDRLFEAERRTALGDLARAISHDLNNAFGVIQPLLETLRRDARDGKLSAEGLRQDLDTLDQYVRASLRIFQGLLQFSRGEVEPARRIDIGDCIESVLSLLEPDLKRRRIAVETRIEEDLPRIHARRQGIEQLLLNLITNAKESMPEGGRLTIGARWEKDGEGQTLRVSIADTGRGISQEVLERIFEPFFTTKLRGTGLGLDICRSIVWEYDGALWLESEVGKGTVAHVRLPARASTAESAPEEESV